MKTLIVVLLSMCCLHAYSQKDTVWSKYEIGTDTAAKIDYMTYPFIVQYVPRVLEKEWEYAAGDGKNIVMYVNAKSILKDEGEKGVHYYKMWIKSIHLTADIKDKHYNNIYCLERVFVDCKNNKYKSMRLAYYDGKTNELIETFDFEDDKYKWEEPIINSIGDAILKKSCEAIAASYLPKPKTKNK